MIYSDSLIEVSEIGVRFRNYYFPMGSKSVPFADIISVESKPTKLLNGKWRLWWTGDFMTWFPGIGSDTREAPFFPSTGQPKDSHWLHG